MTPSYEPTSASEIVLYQTEDQLTRIQVRLEGGTVWLTQSQIAELFQTTPQNVTLHLKAIYRDGELEPEATCKDYLQVRGEGERHVRRSLKHYNLDAILAVGYRVRSARGTQFRQWATTRLREYLVKGFVLDDVRLKEPGGLDYFDELLVRIREIRASEKRFYQKVRDLYATAVDYDSRSEQAQLFFKKVQNKMLWAVTGQTAAELIAGRSNPALPNMGLQSWSGGRVRKHDVVVAKNYLRRPEIEELDRIVVMYLDYAEDQARRRKAMTMADWEEKLNSFLRFNERNLLSHAGKVRAEVAEDLALERFGRFDAQRRVHELEAADAEDLKAIEALQKRLPGKPKSGKRS
jgi:hypothetical protein